ncbi:MAG: VanW family protein [Tissierellia bacterium]|nr:VanW family protein [Tissierellia bacterium]MDD4725286.1 VanW family protein [Tissierellia bacterium]
MKKVYLILLLVIVILGGILGAGFYVYNTEINTGSIYRGITIDNYDIGGMTKIEALNFIKENKQNDYQDKTFKLSYGNKNYIVTLNDIGYSYDYESAIEEAFNIARKGNPIGRYISINELKSHKKEIRIEPEYDKNLLLELVDRIKKDFNQHSIDATFDFNNGDFIVTEENKGTILKESELINLLVDNMDKLEDINIPVEVKEPVITKELLNRINGVIGEFSTSFKGSSYGRIQNIKIAAQKVSDLLVLPGDEISFNETVGSVTSNTGFKEAPVILNGELTPGMGGGICQTSTTLYNALLLADVKIVERHPHSIAAVYVPRGTDGAVASGYLDLKFKNNFDFPIYITSKSVGNNIYFYVYGDTAAIDYTVIIEPELLQTIPYRVHETLDPDAEPGSREILQEGRTGYKVRTYKSIIKDGKVVDRYQINYDYYREKDFIYKVGPELPENNQPEEVTVPLLDEIQEIIDEEPSIVDPVYNEPMEEVTDENIEAIDIP